jgi:hypothetical protein
MISWIASGLTLAGNVVLIRYKSWKTFVIFLIGNSLFAYDWYVKKEWAVFLLVVVFIFQNIWGIYSWRKEKHI